MIKNLEKNIGDGGAPKINNPQQTQSQPVLGSVSIKPWTLRTSLVLKICKILEWC